MKRILNRLSIIVVVIVGSIMYANTQKENRNIGEAVQVTSLPVSGKVIVLDAGHGTPDEGDKMLKLKNKTLQMAIYQRKTLVG